MNPHLLEALNYLVWYAWVDHTTYDQGELPYDIDKMAYQAARSVGSEGMALYLCAMRSPDFAAALCTLYLTARHPGLTRPSLGQTYPYLAWQFAPHLRDIAKANGMPAIRTPVHDYPFAYGSPTHDRGELVSRSFMWPPQIGFIKPHILAWQRETDASFPRAPVARWHPNSQDSMTTERAINLLRHVPEY